LAYRWILEAARGEKGRPISNRLADELYAAARGEGKAMQTRDQTHRMAEANRAFAHFAN
jgi:small subunit ribosomal protein S7